MPTTTYRRLRSDDEWHEHSRIAEYAFNGHAGDEKAIAARERWYERDWLLAGFDGGEMVAGLAVIPFEMQLNGAAIPMGGIASVSSLPERRRAGYVGGLLTASLAAMRDAGQPLSALYTPHYSLYRRYGWEQASRIISYSFPPKHMRTRLPAPKGTYRRIAADAWPELDALYRVSVGGRNGALMRPERWWRTQIMTTWRGDPRDAVVWSDEAGEPRGYAVYRSISRTDANGFGETTLRVQDWVALDAGAYAALLTYLLSHDLATRIVMLAGTEEPFAAAFEEPTHFEEPNRAWSGIMLRLVDVEQAIAARPALPQASGKSVVIALTDTSAPWNAGTWRIEAAEGAMRAARTDAAPELEMDVRALAPIYNGFTKPGDALRVGQVRALSADAVVAATDIFAVSHAPFTGDDF